MAVGAMLRTTATPPPPCALMQSFSYNARLSFRQVAAINTMPKFVIEGQSHGRLAKLAISAGSLLALVLSAAMRLQKRAERCPPFRRGLRLLATCCR